MEIINLKLSEEEAGYLEGAIAFVLWSSEDRKGSEEFCNSIRSILKSLRKARGSE